MKALIIKIAEVSMPERPSYYQLELEIDPELMTMPTHEEVKKLHLGFVELKQ
jgi:hypothetical protein